MEAFITILMRTIILWEGTHAIGEYVSPPPWQAGEWAGDVLSGCAVVQVLTGTREPQQLKAVERCYDGKKRDDQTWRDESGAGLAKCLQWENTKASGSAIIDATAISDLSSLLNNSTRLQGTKSNCWLVRGAFDLRALHPALPSSLCFGGGECMHRLLACSLRRVGDTMLQVLRGRARERSRWLLPNE